MGYVYRSAAIDAGDAVDEPAPSHLFPTVATPGARLPHATLRGPGGTLSTHDLIGQGLTLITGPGGDAWLDAATKVAAGMPFPITAHVVGADLDSADGIFCERFGLGSDGAVLVRPDGHIAWRREAGTVVDHAAALRAAVARRDRLRGDGSKPARDGARDGRRRPDQIRSCPASLRPGPAPGP